MTLADYARAAPLAALRAYGFGPRRRRTGKPTAVLRHFRDEDAVSAAIDTIGTTGLQLLSVLTLVGEPVGPERLAFETRSADPDVIADAVERLQHAGLVTSRNRRLRVASSVAPYLEVAVVSLNDPQAITSEELRHLCQTLGLRAGTTKASRVAALAEYYGKPERRTQLWASLSEPARELLDRIAVTAGPRLIEPETVGIPSHHLRYGVTHRLLSQSADSESEPILELIARGIVGVAGWEHRLWIWKEAWPLLGRPFFSEWPSPPAPAVVGIDVGTPRLPVAVGVLDQAMRLWTAAPPTVLRNDEDRLGKPEIKATARTLGADEVTVDTVSRLAIGIGLLLPNVVGRRGRGRKATVDQVWLADPSLSASWDSLSPMRRWARLVAEWCNPGVDVGEERLTNRHLVLWYLMQLAAGDAYADLDSFAAWFGSRHAPVGAVEGALECIGELRALGVVTPAAIALTAAGRSVLTDPAGADDLIGEASGMITLQSDLTAIGGADLRPDIAVALDALATVESSAGAVTWRLDAGRITRAVQGGQSADDIVAWLTEVSSTPVPDTVVRLVRDAAAAAGSVTLIAAPTVLVVTDPADLTAALGLKSLKLTRIADTAAVTDVPLAKVRAALERRGITPDTVVGGAPRQARSSAAEAAEAAQRAELLRARAGGRGASYITSHADHLERHARTLADTDGRLAVRGPLTLLPQVLDQLEGER